MDCIFCRIVSGEIPSWKIHETGLSLAFLDAFPLARGHALVIPKAHYLKVQEMPRNENSDLFGLVQDVAQRMERLAPSSLIAVHNGRDSGQEVPHVHVHVIPRKEDDGAGPVHSMFGTRPKMGDSEFEKVLEALKG